ncbi:MAG: mercury transporter MerT [Calditrichaeota bacterium]|nr:MAG: mercury transporter MerT [Calditrichota bacterium]
MSTPTPEKKASEKLGIIGAVVAAIGASICCIGPLILLALGIGGAWVGNLAAFEKYRPIFIVFTLGFLGFAYYRVYRKPKEECEPGSACATPNANRRNKILLWIVTVVALGLMAFPYIAPNLVRTGQVQATTNVTTAVLEVHNMTCGGCALTVNKALASVDGVIEARVTFEPPQAVVKYDPNKVSLEELLAATEGAGYPSEVKAKQK